MHIEYGKSNFQEPLCLLLHVLYAGSRLLYCCSMLFVYVYDFLVNLETDILIYSSRFIFPASWHELFSKAANVPTPFPRGAVAANNIKRLAREVWFCHRHRKRFGHNFRARCRRGRGRRKCGRWRGGRQRSWSRRRRGCR